MLSKCAKSIVVLVWISLEWYTIVNITLQYRLLLALNHILYALKIIYFTQQWSFTLRPNDCMISVFMYGKLKFLTFVYFKKQFCIFSATHFPTSVTTFQVYFNCIKTFQLQRHFQPRTYQLKTFQVHVLSNFSFPTKCFPFSLIHITFLLISKKSFVGLVSARNYWWSVDFQLLCWLPVGLYVLCWLSSRWWFYICY